MRNWGLAIIFCVGGAAFAAEPAAEVLEPDDTTPAPTPAKPANDADILTPAPGPGGDTEPVPEQKVNPPLELNEPDFKAKVVYRTETAPNAEPSPINQPDPTLRGWSLAEEEGVTPESDVAAGMDTAVEISPLLAKAIAKDKGAKKPKDSLPAFEAVVEAEPDNAEAWYYLGVTQVKAGEAAKGAASLEKAVTLKPKNPKYLCTFGQAALQAGLIEKALLGTQAAAVAVPSDPRYQSAYGDVLLAVGKYPEAAAAYARAVALDKGQTPGYIYNLGLVHLHCREFKKAIQIFDEAIAARSDYAPYYCSRGLAYENLKQIKQAGSDYATAIKIDKNNAYAHFLLAGIYSDPDDPTYTNKFEAVSHAEKACKLTEFKNARYLMGLARALRVAFNYEEAVIAARKAIAIDPREEYRQELAKYEKQLKQEGAFLKDGNK